MLLSYTIFFFVLIIFLIPVVYQRVEIKGLFLIRDFIQSEKDSSEGIFDISSEDKRKLCFEIESRFRQIFRLNDIIALLFLILSCSLSIGLIVTGFIFKPPFSIETKVIIFFTLTSVTAYMLSRYLLCKIGFLGHAKQVDELILSIWEDCKCFEFTDDKRISSTLKNILEKRDSKK